MNEKNPHNPDVANEIFEGGGNQSTEEHQGELQGDPLEHHGYYDEFLDHLTREDVKEIYAAGHQEVKESLDSKDDGRRCPA